MVVKLPVKYVIPIHGSRIFLVPDGHSGEQALPSTGYCRMKGSNNDFRVRDGRQMNPQEGHFIRRLPERVRIGAKKKGS